MRRAFLGFFATTLVACGVFGASDNPAPSTPQDNAQPPVGGAPVGVFVSASLGQDDGSGSSVRPVRTLAQAFALAKEQGVRVIACAEEYAEAVTLLDGVSAYANYDCTKDPWEPVAARAIVRSPSSPAVVAKGLVLPTRLEGFEIRSPDLDAAPATDAAGTSLALEIRNVKGLVISHTLVHAGKGAPGSDGVEGPLNERTKASDGKPATDQGTTTCDPAIQRCSALRIFGAAGGITTCTIAPAGGTGGQGGDGRFFINGVESTGTVEYRGRALVATAETAQGGLNEDAQGLFRGLPGTDGADGAEGADGVNGAWTLETTGFSRGNGTAGAAGKAGQGGGGGAGSRAGFTANGGEISPVQIGYYQTANGGGGGGGGCGGQPGTPGTGGGASIGALVIDSDVTFEGTRIEASKGGRAGAGNLATTPSNGGAGGLGTSHTVETTGHGGHGGYGGHGGASGHGAPGPSIALAYSKARPVMTEVDLAPGEGGDGQPLLTKVVGGKVGTKSLPAIVGESKAEHVVTR